jgi:hypothetical protein
MISPKIDPMRAQIALALYPRYLEFMDRDSRNDDGPPYNLATAASDAVLAADYLMAALSEQTGCLESDPYCLSDAIEAAR